MAVFGKVSGYFAPRGATDNELFRWRTKPKDTQSDGSSSPPSLACAEPDPEYWSIAPGNPARLSFILGFEMAGATGMTIIDKSLRALFLQPFIYNIPAFADFVNAPTPSCAPILVEGANAERT